jgi:hypothetical protein
VVAHRDRLARIGYGLLEHVFLRAGSVLTIVEDNACDGCPEELHEDVMAVLTHFTAKHNGKRSYANRKVARSLKIRILPNAEQKSFSSSTLGRRDTFTTKRRHWLKVCPTRATAIAGWEAEHDGTCKEIAAKACNKMKCKTHGEVSGCATQKQADSGKNRCWFVKESHKCGGDVIDPEAMPGSKLRYFCEDHVPSRCLRSEAKSRAATDASKRWKKLSEFVNTRDATLCDDLEVGEIYKYYCDDHSEIYADKIPKVPVPMSVWSFQSLRNASSSQRRAARRQEMDG